MNKDELFKQFKPRRMYQHKKGGQSGIYIIDSFETEKLYIGSSANLSKRTWNEHYNELKNNRHGNPYLQNHVNKYGLKDLAYYILDICSESKLLAREQWFLDNVDRKIQFNIAVTAGSNYGMKFSEEHKQKIGEAHKGKKHSEECKQKMSKTRKDREFSEEHKQKLSEALKGRVLTEEWKNKIREKNKDKKTVRKP